MEKHEHYTIVRVREQRLDAALTQDFKAYVFNILDGGCFNIGLDISDVTFVDSTGLGVLVALLNRIGQDGTLLLWNIAPTVKSVLELTQLYKVFDIYETEEDALAQFA
jgi:anti-anti-sigma factor